MTALNSVVELLSGIDARILSGERGASATQRSGSAVAGGSCLMALNNRCARRAQVQDDTAKCIHP